jgi:hypothetical protein
MSSKYLEKLQKTLENEREERRNVTQTKKMVVWKPPRCCMQLVSLEYVAALQKQQAKACWKCCKNTKFVTEISVYTQKISSKRYDMKNIFCDLSKS